MALTLHTHKRGQALGLPTMVLVALKRLLLNVLRKQHPQRTVRSEASGVVVNMNLIGPGAPP